MLGETAIDDVVSSSSLSDTKSITIGDGIFKFTASNDVNEKDAYSKFIASLEIKQEGNQEEEREKEFAREITSLPGKIVPVDEGSVP